jgi:chromate reductase
MSGICQLFAKDSSVRHHGDAEAERGLPDGAYTLKCSIAEHQALLIATPEHNGGNLALLKNAID